MVNCGKVIKEEKEYHSVIFSSSHSDGSQGNAVLVFKRILMTLEPSYKEGNPWNMQKMKGVNQHNCTFKQDF